METEATGVKLTAVMISAVGSCAVLMRFPCPVPTSRAGGCEGQSQSGGSGGGGVESLSAWTPSRTDGDSLGSPSTHHPFIGRSLLNSRMFVNAQALFSTLPYTLPLWGLKSRR